MISFDGKVTFLIEGFALALKKNELYFSERLPVSDEEKKRPSEKSLCEDEKKYSDEPEAVRAAGKMVTVSLCDVTLSHLSPCPQSRSLVWCPVYKAASTNWCYNLLHLAGRTETEIKEIIGRHP